MAKRGGFPGGMPGNMNNLMKQAQKMQKQMAETTKALEEKSYEASAGGGVVSVTVSGKKEVTAIKIAEDMNRPCLLLRKHINPETGLVEMSGSARNVDHSPIDSLKDVISETNSFLWAKGHANAFGCSTDNISKAITELNDKLKDI